MPSPRRHHHGGPRDRVGSKERDKHHGPGTNRRRTPWDHRPRGLNRRGTFRGQVSPRTDIQVTKDERKTGEPPDPPRQGPRKRGRDREETNTYKEPRSRQLSISHEPTNHGHHRRGTGSGELAKSSAGEKDRPRGQGGAAKGDTGSMPRWETKRRRSAAAVFDLGHFVPGKESYPPLPTDENEAGGPELPQNPYLEERLPLKAGIAAEPNDQWLLDDYLPTVHLNEALMVSTGTATMMGPRSEASSNDLSENALRADNRGREGQGGAPLGEERDGETWGLPALDLWLAGEIEPVLSPP